MDFKNYAGGGKEKKAPKDYTLEDFSQSDVESVNNMVNKYAGKSDDAIMNELIAMVTKQRKEGKISDRDLDNFAENAGMMMNPEQRAKLYSVIKSLKQSH